MNEGSFDLPDVGFEDRTEPVLDVPVDGNGKVEVRVQRGPRPKDLDALAEERMASSKKTLRGCSVVFQRRREHPQAEVLEVGLRYRGETTMAYRREIYLNDATTLFIVAVTGRIEDWESVDGIIESIVATASVRDTHV